MDLYKDFIQKLRRLSFNEVYIMIGRDLTPLLKHFVYLLTEVKFKESSYFALYDEFKKIISSFLVFHLRTTDTIVKEADKYTHVVKSKEELLRLVEETMSTHHSNQINFGKEFLPVKNAEEKRVYEEIESEFNSFMEKMYAFRESISIKLYKQELVDEFVAVHFQRAPVNVDKVFTFTNIFIATLLADRMEDIRMSIEGISIRMSNNLKELQSEFKGSLNNLFHKLYDKNKDGLIASRCMKRCSIESAEVNKSIEMAYKQIERFEAETSLQRLENEVAYWKKRVLQFNKIRDNLVNLKAQQDDIIKQEKIYNSLECFDPPGSKRQCWVNMGLNYAERKETLKEMIIRESRAFITFFAVRGYDRILYSDNKGLYYVDELKHQIYVSDYALTLRHVNCEGEFVKVVEKPYYFDKNGRYIIENGEKIYQCAHCSSHYKLGEDTLLKKITKDCGHSEAQNRHCKMTIKDPNIFELLPDFMPMDIKGSLDAETVKYLWDSFGSILPDALYDVCVKRPRNPIHMLAHRLLYHKYSVTAKELADKKEKADQYRLDRLKKRREKEAEASMVWKSKQTKRRKPEESDDLQESAVLNAQQAERDFINYLNYYNYEL